MGAYWKGIIATFGSVLGLVVHYTDLWNTQWLPALIAIATILGVVAKANTRNGENVDAAKR